MTSETQINDLKLSANGSLLYAAMGTTVRIWDLERWVMRSVVFKPEQKLLVQMKFFVRFIASKQLSSDLFCDNLAMLSFLELSTWTPIHMVFC